MLTYNKNLATTLKRIRTEQLTQDDDLTKAWNVIGMSLESLQQILTYLEGSSNTNLAQTNAQNFEQLLLKALEQIKRCQIQVFKRNSHARK